MVKTHGFPVNFPNKTNPVIGNSMLKKRNFSSAWRYEQTIAATSLISRMPRLRRSSWSYEVYFNIISIWYQYDININDIYIYIYQYSWYIILILYWYYIDIILISYWYYIDIILISYWYHIDIILILYLVGGKTTPLKNMSSSVGMICPFPIYGKSFKIPWFQSPPTSIILILYWYSLHQKWGFSSH